MTSIHVCRGFRNWWPLVEGRLLAVPCQFRLPEDETVLEQINVWCRLYNQHQNRVSTSGVAIWRVVLIQLSDSLSKGASHNLSVRWFHSLRNKLAIAIPTIYSPNILAASFRTPSLLWKRSQPMANWTFGLSGYPCNFIQPTCTSHALVSNV